MPHALKDQEIAMLRSELEMLMNERQTLLRIAGAAAAFVAELDSRKLPEETYEAAEFLAEYLNEATEETIRDALEAVRAEIAGDGGDGRQEQLSSEVTTDSGLVYEDLAQGEGPAAEAGRLVTVHYTGWLTNGTKFDSSKDRNDPFVFPLGAGHVIRGWDEGVQGMKVGGVRKLTIPSQLGYGARGAGGVIPPNATLVFEVELLDIR